MSLVLAGPRRIFVLLAFCECLGRERRIASSPLLELAACDVLDAAGSPARSESIARIRRLHWVVAGWLVGLTWLVIERGTPAGAR